MSVIQWPAPMPEAGRLPQAKRASGDGKAKVCDPKMECPQTLHISLFFDGTNNNDAPDNPHRDSLTQSQTNVARLYDVAQDTPASGIFSSYIPGVGTPFPQIGETTYSMMGEGFALGYAMRVAWAYTRVLNAIYSAIMGRSDIALLPDDAAYTASRALTGDKSVVNNLPYRYSALKAAHRQARDESRRHRTIRKVWINVFGFSRGAAQARSFASRLIQIWAPGGKIADEFDYTVNFLGLFDTVASVGPPDSARTVVPLKELDGHWEWTSNGQLDIPDPVRRCVHFFSIHEQRMSFPLDTIRIGSAYPGQEDRFLEVPYPGVHSDVGGGYPPGEQGKAVSGDAAKLSQIPLHDMYIEALRAGVPLKVDTDMKDRERANFELDAKLIEAFNIWLKTTPAIGKVEDAMRFGMGQMLSWRSLRARIGTTDYVTERPFFQHAHEGTKSREQVREDTQQLIEHDPAIQQLKRQRTDLVSGIEIAGMSAIADPFSSVEPTDDIGKTMDDCQHALDQNKAAMARAREADAAKAAGLDPSVVKPGTGPDDLIRNDKTDLQEAAEEFRVLLTWLYPDQTKTWQTKIDLLTNLPGAKRERATPLHPPDTDIIYMKTPDLLTRLGAILPYLAFDDAVIQPRTVLKTFLHQHTALAEVDALRKASDVVRLYDDYIHDSRAWFRVPYFREYVPGGYFWARVLFTGGDQRVENLGMG
jgi:hypothetical protein